MKLRNAFLFGACLSLASVAMADTYYGISSADDTLITMDTTVGTPTVVGSIGFNADSTGLAVNTRGVTVMGTSYSAGTLFGYNRGSRELFTLNTSTGAANIIGTVSGIGSSAESLTFDLNGNLFTNDGGNYMQIDLGTLAATTVASGTGFIADGLDVLEQDTTVDGQVYAAGTFIGVDTGIITFMDSGFNVLTSISAGSGAADETIATSFTGNIFGTGGSVSNYDVNALSFDPFSSTSVGMVGAGSVFGSEIVAVPEPTTMAVLGLGALALLRKKRKKA